MGWRGVLLASIAATVTHCPWHAALEGLGAAKNAEMSWSWKPDIHKTQDTLSRAQAHYLQRHTQTPTEGILYRLFTHTHIHTHTLVYADTQVVGEITVVECRHNRIPVHRGTATSPRAFFRAETGGANKPQVTGTAFLPSAAGKEARVKNKQTKKTCRFNKPSSRSEGKKKKKKKDDAWKCHPLH